MGSGASTPRPMPATAIEHQDIYTQIGRENIINQSNSIAQGLANIHWYLYIFFILILMLLTFFMVRYFNICLNKKIERRAQASVFKVRRAELEDV